MKHYKGRMMGRISSKWSIVLSEPVQTLITCIMQVIIKGVKHTKDDVWIHDNIWHKKVRLILCMDSRLHAMQLG
jgi:hypothetical protein